MSKLPKWDELNETMRDCLADFVAGESDDDATGFAAELIAESDAVRVDPEIEHAAQVRQRAIWALAAADRAIVAKLARKHEHGITQMMVAKHCVDAFAKLVAFIGTKRLLLATPISAHDRVMLAAADATSEMLKRDFLYKLGFGSI